MPPPVAVSRDVPAPDLPATGHPATAPDSRVPSTSLAHVAALVREAVPPMHPGGRPIVVGVAVAAGLARLVTGRGALVGGLVTAATAAFFRNPHRVPPSRTGVVLSAADGTVALVSEVVPPPELDLPRVPAPRVSVFLSVLDVHVQRIPADGRVVDVQYRQGRFLSADLDKASEDNERNALLLETVDGARVGVVQIAGLLARRIRCDVAPGDEVAAGETYGLIRFGSRVDTYLPAGSTVTVEVGQRTIGGETVLAELPGIPELPGSAVPQDPSASGPG
jgi:phosphatidylserine decarboxylase